MQVKFGRERQKTKREEDLGGCSVAVRLSHFRLAKAGDLPAICQLG